jgi:hypothetical protein
MKKENITMLLALFIFACLVSCSPGRWVKGNSKHFQQRYDAKVKKQPQKQVTKF